ncbi:proteoglycan 4-like isoform X1 [Cataglyphis hispanica]|uniref:proteoglycan 4-like isoform X1 n=1 Tax=Cataglyphis hispanica TaxID=1086592 RepID=UPI0021806467|nr:proteoglycan 4-like isoform X1 [Cataglyphis hispanica]
MATQKARLVNKQFNSPINLYSPQAIQETLDRQTQVLANGAVGIDFNQLAKPANLQNSAVLRMLEEEEARQRGGQPGLKRVAWPPPPEDQDFDYVEQTPIQAKTRGYGDLGSYQSSPTSGPSPQPSSAVTPQRAVPSSPSPVSPGSTLLRQPSHFQQTNPKGWAPVTPPATSPLPHQQHPPFPSQHQQSQPWQQHPQDPNDRTPQRHQQTQSSYHPSIPAAFEAPPSTIILRPEPPISQTPAPVYQAQPAATKAPATGNMRGDLKWPPASVKAQVEAENRARIELAKGPVFRPRRVNKDYSGFFAQHALNNSYPGYRAPPGTQYFTPAYHH